MSGEPRSFQSTVRQRPRSAALHLRAQSGDVPHLEAIAPAGFPPQLHSAGQPSACGSASFRAVSVQWIASTVGEDGDIKDIHTSSRYVPVSVICPSGGEKESPKVSGIEVTNV